MHFNELQSGLESGQIQFREMIIRGMSYINDPKQVVLTGDQGEIVNGVLYGDFDVGFVRTDQIECTKDRVTGKIVDKKLFKIIEPEEGLEINGEQFPFESSTRLYPGWNIAAMTHVHEDVASEVQQALLNLESHADIGSNILNCYSEKNCTLDDDACERNCESLSLQNQALVLPPETSAELALVANEAKINGRYVGFRSSLSYMELRNMQSDIGFISRDDNTGNYKCIRPSRTYDAIVCPPGHIKQNEDTVVNGCSLAGLRCDANFQCLCRPCVKAFDVDVFPKSESSDRTAPCKKMDICATKEQLSLVSFFFVDNLKRDNVRFDVRFVERDKTDYADITYIGDFTYEFTIEPRERGISILEILADGEQISQSPLRVETANRNCQEEYNDGWRIADLEGNCICVTGSLYIAGSCVRYSAFLPSILVPLLVIFMIAGFFFIEYKRKKHDSIWRVNQSDLEFDDPPAVIGRGTLGLVLLAGYRGTTVAVKRVIPPKLINNTENKNPELGSGDMNELDDGHRVSYYMDPKDSDRTSISSFDFSRSGKFSAFANGKASGRASVSAGSLYGQNVVTKKFPIMKKFLVLNKIRGKDEYSKLKSDFITEMRQLSKLRHPCITTVMGAVIGGCQEPKLIMEHMQLGSLHDLLHNDSMAIEGEVLLPILKDIVKGLRFLHSFNPPVIHGDLKARNILVDSKLRAKVADFGLSQKKRVGVTGTPLWMAPELLLGKSTNSITSDCFSFGIMLYEIYSRKEPYEGEDPQLVLQQVCNPGINKRPPIPPTCPAKISEIMIECVHMDPARRPSFGDIDDELKRLNVDSVEPGLNVISMQISKQSRLCKNETLLLEVFPKRIADALKEGKKIEPEHHECVTIYFSDIVGFTNISSILTPLKVSDMLDRLYEKFDNLSRDHDVFKIETIGDAYMAVTNLVCHQEDHALRIAKFARDTVNAASETLIDVDNPELGYVNIRVGFNSGPVVSNVVGNRNPKFTIIGDTVNCAARMESNSLPLKIHCSEASALILKEKHPEVPLDPRGSIPIKGKGEMETFWVYNYYDGGFVRRGGRRRGSINSLTSSVENGSNSFK